ncbi:MAG TPA: 6-phosphogluconolactonase [Solirubrobacteraceae bacterium]|jgi:6-phosphogluconolactonase|nr:6-phosphogluconolactonase [Solirubrobacteraceae bacterium]
MTRLTTLPDPQAAAEYAAGEIAQALREALERRGVAHLALSGGSTPRAAYQVLAGLLEDWKAVELWYGDERCVAPDDPESTHRLVAESLLAHIPGDGRAAPIEHRVRGELGPEAAAQEYAAELRAAVAPAEPGGLPALDVSLVGIGEDGHTASLFPGHPEVEDSSGALCLPVRNSPKPPPERVTLSLPVLRAARCSLLLVAGAGKAEALAAALAGPDPRVPASLLASERLHVVADAAAAARARPGDALSPSS